MQDTLFILPNNFYIFCLMLCSSSNLRNAVSFILSFDNCVIFMQILHRFCIYPQDIVIQLEKRTRVRKIQILSHQYLIRKYA